MAGPALFKVNNLPQIGMMNGRPVFARGFTIDLNNLLAMGVTQYKEGINRASIAAELSKKSGLNITEATLKEIGLEEKGINASGLLNAVRTSALKNVDLAAKIGLQLRTTDAGEPYAPLSALLGGYCDPAEALGRFDIKYALGSKHETDLGKAHLAIADMHFNDFGEGFFDGAAGDVDMPRAINFMADTARHFVSNKNYDKKKFLTIVAIYLFPNDRTKVDEFIENAFARLNNISLENTG